MADRVVGNQDNEVPEIPEILEKVMLFSLDEAKQKLTQSNEVVPFTALAVKENLFIESHPGDSSEECYNLAQHTVEGARGADAYAFCYDGYVETDDAPPLADDGWTFVAFTHLQDCLRFIESDDVEIGVLPHGGVSLRAVASTFDTELRVHTVPRNRSGFKAHNPGAGYVALDPAWLGGLNVKHNLGDGQFGRGSVLRSTSPATPRCQTLKGHLLGITFAHVSRF